VLKHFKSILWFFQSQLVCLFPEYLFSTTSFSIIRIKPDGLLQSQELLQQLSLLCSINTLLAASNKTISIW
uniref:hypothetical protein n=1 Tax=Gemmiger formicilis TaxID=745368 RepID=UPI004027E2F9